ncbi:uncharacterized protein LOC126894987 isoform X2 [Daktulosphaira vitifoliae]|uniref:uncharacterized protein LOC126894987 isoform X1 n=1 Tax=Daktulosphaira vitifoliae TaxID=58002 RepID=UPI0021AAB603|nr:uncharacterized protein LOC126894987 isoform X1 [Daktulosphaira vitifoliae]XP_050522357.1 uncharacterized protein LOC126894987 isoform X2 [Daktulosphaira vitifoliae]
MPRFIRFFLIKKIIMSSVSPPMVYDDVTINTFMKLIVERSQSQVYAFDTLFILEFKKSGFEAIHQQITIDLFKKTLLLAPLYVNNTHWTLVAVHVSNKDITFYDNMNCTISEMIWKIRQFIIFCEFKQYGCTSNWQIYRGETTTLNNNDDCGPGIVEIAERISRGYPPLINLSLLKDYMKNHKQILEENFLHIYHDPAQFTNPPPLRPPTPTGIKIIETNHIKKRTLKNKNYKYLKNLRQKTRFRKYYKHLNKQRILLTEPVPLKTLKPKRTPYSQQLKKEKRDEFISIQSMNSSPGK